MPSIIANNVACVGITSNEEARVVREHGFEGKIMRVRAASRNEIENGVQYEIEELIGTKMPGGSNHRYCIQLQYRYSCSPCSEYFRHGS